MKINLFVRIKVWISFLMAVLMMLTSMSCSNKKPKEIIVKERQEIMRYFEKRNPNDTFRFKKIVGYTKFDPDKPYSTGLNYNKRSSEIYYLTSKLLHDKDDPHANDFSVEIYWDKDWKSLDIGEDTYAQKFLSAAFKQEITKVLAHPKEFLNSYTEVDLPRRVREKIKSFDDAKARIDKEKGSITFESYFHLRVDDYASFKNKAYQNAKIIEYIKAISKINDCNNKLIVDFTSETVVEDKPKMEYLRLSVNWKSGELENITNYQEFLQSHLIQE